MRRPVELAAPPCRASPRMTIEFVKEDYAWVLQLFELNKKSMTISTKTGIHIVQLMVGTFERAFLEHKNCNNQCCLFDSFQISLKYLDLVTPCV